MHAQLTGIHSPGIASLLTGQPFDTIKTRLQAQSSGVTPEHSQSQSQSQTRGRTIPTSTSPLLSNTIHAGQNADHARRSVSTVTSQPPPRYYKSATDAFRIIVREEKFLGLFKGVTSPMLGVAAMNACIFGSYGLALRAQQGASTDPTLGQVMLAGCASGVASAFITSPIELLKIREQLDYTGKGAKPQTWTIFKRIWSTSGIRGLYRGLGVTCIRDLGYGPYFFSYELINRLLLSLHEATPLPGEHSTPRLSNLELAFSGAVAGVLAWVSTFPIDCIKTRVQAQEQSSSGGMSAAARDIYQQGGGRAFWRGVGATVLRAIPVNATLFVVYEVTKDSLIKWGW